MADTVEIASNGDSTHGYLAMPPGGEGPGVVVVQEWWGVDPSLKEVADRLAAGGFVVLVPDLFRGELAQHDEMDKAAELMQALPPDRAARDMSGAVDFLASHDAVNGKGLGVVGFCMGGMLSWLLATDRPDKVKALVPFYGFPQGDSEPDWSKLDAPVQGHMAENDDFFSPDAARALEEKLHAMGKDVTLTVYPGAGHAFMNPHNPTGTLDEKLAEQIWPEVISFLHTHLD